MSQCKIYTRTGDKGTTNLGTTRISKVNIEILILGKMDLLQSHLGMVDALITEHENAKENMSSLSEWSNAKKDIKKIQFFLYTLSATIHRKHSNIADADDGSGSRKKRTDDFRVSANNWIVSFFIDNAISLLHFLFQEKCKNEVRKIPVDSDGAIIQDINSDSAGDVSDDDSNSDSDSVSDDSDIDSDSASDDSDIDSVNVDISEGEDKKTNEGIKKEECVTTEWLEASMDGMSQSLPPLRNFIRPSKNPITATIHIARSVCRELEVLLFSAIDSEKTVLVGSDAKTINRLSDWLFVFARHCHRLSLPDEMEEVFIY